VATNGGNAVMGLSHSPRIVTDGLVLCLDAANSRSYPGTGTTWTDLKGENNGTLTNGLTFDGDNNGGIVFDGTNEYVSLNSNSLTAGDSPFTVCAWVKTSSSSRQLFFALDHQSHLDLNAYNTTGRTISFNKYNTFVMHAPVSTLTLDIPQFLCWTHSGGSVNETNSKMYINGGLLSGYSYTYGSAASYSINTSQSNSISKTSDSTTYSGANFITGNVYQTLAYNRALTADQVRQNYLATKGRYE
jgi:hypothetical protein